MKNFFKNVLANIVAILLVAGAFFMLMLIFVAVAAAGDAEKPHIKANTVLTLDSKTQILDSPTEENDNVFDFKKEKKTVTAYNIIRAIEKAKTDDHIKGISIEADFLDAGFTQIDDIRTALEDFKKSGKFVYAYGNTVSQPSYLLGSVAQQYFLNPAGAIELKGLSREQTFYKQFLDKYGIGVQVIRHGKFKAAVEPLLRDEMSPENTEQLSMILKDLWSNTSQKVAASRKIDTAQFRVIVDSLYGIIPQESVKYRLADKLLQKTEYDNLLKSKVGIKNDDKLSKISLGHYAATLEDGGNKSANVAVLYASGTILNGDEYGEIHSEKFIKEIKKLAEDDDVEAVVLRVNSPGGSANAADEILFELQQLRGKKPLMVSFGDYAASGGYYIAMAGHKIFSEPNTVTGSIGVFGAVPYFKNLANRNGIHSSAVKTNANANFYSPIEGFSTGALAMMTKNVEQVYKRFVGFVMQNRKKTFDEVDQVGGGRVWSGTRAKQLGLVDELGSLNDAVKAAAAAAKLNDYSVVTYPKRKSGFERLFEDMDSEADISEKLLKSKLGSEEFQLYQQIMHPKAEVMMKLPFAIHYK